MWGRHAIIERTVVNRIRCTRAGVRDVRRGRWIERWSVTVACVGGGMGWRVAVVVRKWGMLTGKVGIWAVYWRWIYDWYGSGRGRVSGGQIVSVIEG